jgi:hypothetical protein
MREPCENHAESATLVHNAIQRDHVALLIGGRIHTRWVATGIHKQLEDRRAAWDNGSSARSQESPDRSPVEQVTGLVVRMSTPGVGSLGGRTLIDEAINLGKITSFVGGSIDAFLGVSFSRPPRCGGHWSRRWGDERSRAVAPI